MSWELLAWAMPKILVVCITSTEKLGSQLAMRDPGRECTYGLYCSSSCTQLMWGRSRFPLSLPSKWKKWLCWLMCGMASGAAPAGPMFSSKPPPACCWPLGWPPSALMFRDVRHVGHEVSCSSHERKHELEKHTHTHKCYDDISLHKTWLIIVGLGAASESGQSISLQLWTFKLLRTLKRWQINIHQKKSHITKVNNSSVVRSATKIY